MNVGEAIGLSKVSKMHCLGCGSDGLDSSDRLDGEGVAQCPSCGDWNSCLELDSASD